MVGTIFSIPRDSQGNPEEVAAWVRNYTCPICGTEGVRWRYVGGRYAMAKWVLIENDEFGDEHDCAGEGTGQFKKRSTEPVKQEPVKSKVKAGGLDVSGIAEAVKELIWNDLDAEGKIQQWMNNQGGDTGTISAWEVFDAGRDEINEWINKWTDGWMDRTEEGRKARIDELVEELVDKRLPREHIIKVQDPVGNVKASFSGQPHFKLEQLVQVISARIHVMMVGPAGGGKTTGASMAAEVVGLNYYEKSMGPATSQWDLVGFLSPDGKYIPGILREPFEHGGVLMLDEIDNCNPSVLTALNSALANGHASFPDKMIEKHPDFVVIAAGNTYGRGADRLYVGRTQLDGASLDRFAVMDWEYDEEAEFDWAGRDMYDWVRYVQAIRKIIFAKKDKFIVSPRASIQGAKLLRTGMDVKTVADMLIWKGMDASDRDSIESQVRREQFIDRDVLGKNEVWI